MKNKMLEDTAIEIFRTGFKGGLETALEIIEHSKATYSTPSDDVIIRILVKQMETAIEHTKYLK